LASSKHTVILGAGVTGLAAGWASGAPVYEAASAPGGICSSYYVRPHASERLAAPPDDGEAYRFEIGGGHWIFGGDPSVLRLIRHLVPVRSYRRQSAVYFASTGLRVAYPLQYHLAALPDAVATPALREMLDAERPSDATMAAWLEARFGLTLTQHFFGPFHDRYTAGLWTEIAPQDPYKSPVDHRLVKQGAKGKAPAAGYNVEYLYPTPGLDALARRLADGTTVHYDHRAVEIDPDRRQVAFASGPTVDYDVLISTIPLNRMVELVGVGNLGPPDPSTSVLVLNIGARRGARCPDDHWLYVPDSEAGFFRVGCYSNVEPDFLPATGRDERVSLYVERAYPDGARPTPAEVDAYAERVVRELQNWGFIGTAEVVDPTWIDVAYTWKRPGSRWRERALDALAARDIWMVGRYARWTFQGIADSIRDGLVTGSVLTATTEGS
jgi:protoporphyrinogen oxidase